MSEACAHCGDPCPGDRYQYQELLFCCAGCQSVYRILQENGLADFYALDQSAGRSQRNNQTTDYEWLDLPKLSDPFIRYQDGDRTIVRVELPDIHCASCLWLLERLPQLKVGIRTCQVNLAAKIATIEFIPDRISLREVAELLARIGYPPHFVVPGQEGKRHDRRLIYRLGVAGFAFGNIMLLSFPEYFGLGGAAGNMRDFFGYLILLLSMPVVLYSGRDFLTAAGRGLLAGKITIDVPIALGILALFGRSVYEIISATGPGYFDSLAGLVFFLLVGRWFQSYTFARLNFDRDYRDYFPNAAHRLLEDGSTEPVASSELRAGDTILVRPGGLIPADGRLREAATGGIDYSFVTGESAPQTAGAGERVYAGGRAMASALKLEITQSVAGSYLLQLWQRQAKSTSPASVGPSDRLATYFTVAVVSIAIATFGYWYQQDAEVAYRAATAVLIIACPCALALATPFAYGTLQRLLGQLGCYLRGAEVINRLGQVDTFVFDKTGTLVAGKDYAELTYFDTAAPVASGRLLSLARQSAHPRSQSVSVALAGRGVGAVAVGTVRETVGAGVEAVYEGHRYRIGRPDFCNLATDDGNTYGCVDDQVVFALAPAHASLRPGIDSLLAYCAERGTVHLLSGDRRPPEGTWEHFFPLEHQLFRASPFDKEDYVRQLRRQGDRVLMIGDGLNDTAALRAARVGLAVNDRESGFNPACDGVISGAGMARLPEVIGWCRRIRWVLYVTYVIAILYNLVGLSFAVTGTLSPVIAAILMPLSSLSIVILAVAGAYLTQPFRGTNDINHSAK